jgi:hypothetical protein
MGFLNGIGLNSVVGQFAVSHELGVLREIQANGALNGNANGAFGLTNAGKTGLALSEMQNEENTTFLFEYRAYLNSQLTTIITKLTNALSSDLDSVMMMQKAPYQTIGSPRSNMQGGTTNTQLDPGAGRTAYEYLRSWRGGVTNPANAAGLTVATAGPWAMSTSGPASWSVQINDGTLTQTGTPNSATGTFAVITYGNNPIGDAGPNDTLFVDYENLGANDYWQTGIRDDQVNTADGPGMAARLAGNKFEEVLWRESRTSVFRNIIKADLLRDLVVSASTSLSTGSQLQASITMNSRRSGLAPKTSYPLRQPAATGFDSAIDIFLTRFTAFYHS